jgi:hypothetical protein
MRRALFLAAISLVLLPFSCKHDVTPPETSEFVFRVTVQDSTGKPVPGVVVAAWNKLHGFRPWKVGSRKVAHVAGTTLVQCNVPQSCRLTLTVEDLEGRLLRTLLDRDSAMPGRYSVIWSVPATRYAAYWCHLVARDSAGAVLYRDSIVASSWSPEGGANTLGTAASDGVFETRNKFFFPGLFDLGEMLATSVAGESIGAFAWSDTVVITLANPAAGAIYERVLTKGSNAFTFSWPPGPRPDVEAQSRSPELERTPAILTPAGPDSVPVGPPLRFRLYQNVPNPFD